MNKQEEKQEVIYSWRVIYTILKETNNVDLYKAEIETLVNFIKSKLED